MALIKCPECGKDVSDMADVCIHCGYPIQKRLRQTETTCKIGNIEYDLSGALSLMKNKEKVSAVRLVREITGVGLKEAKDICDTIEATGMVPKEYTCMQSVSITHSSAVLPHCPTCGSTNIEKITATSKVVDTVVFGLFGTKRHKSFRCNNCKYEW